MTGSVSAMEEQVARNRVSVSVFKFSSPDERFVELWGRCKSNHSQFSGGSAFLYVNNVDYKWRKPEAPVIPDYCYHLVRETYQEKTESGKKVTKTSK